MASTLLIFYQFQLKISLFHKRNGRYVKAYGISNLTIDVCKYVSGGLTSKLMNMVEDEMKTHSNLLQPCPISVYLIYKIRLKSEMKIKLTLNFQGNVYLREYSIKELLYPTSAHTCLLQVIAATNVAKRELFVAQLKLIYDIKPK